MRKYLIVFIILLISICCFSQTFDGFVWKDLEPDIRIEYIVNIVKAAKKLSIQAGLDEEKRKICETIVKGVEGKTPNDVVSYINSFYKTREDLYTPVVEVLYNYAKNRVMEII